jgi:predicted metal-dependent hydrolase
VSKKTANNAALIGPFGGQDLDPHYLAFFDCFNRQLFFEAHDVLEELWLPQRHGPKGPFYRGLIQLAGAFVHLQKDRPRSAASLFRLAQANLKPYAPICERLDVTNVLAMIQTWLHDLEATSFTRNPLSPTRTPHLKLTEPPD